MKVRKLKGKMVECGLSVDEVAEKIGMHPASMYRKLRRPETMTIIDAVKIKEILELSNEDANDIFFS